MKEFSQSYAFSSAFSLTRKNRVYSSFVPSYIIFHVVLSSSEFVSDFQCTPNQFGRWYQMDSYRSFPSGHASLSVYCGFFLAVNIFFNYIASVLNKVNEVLHKYVWK